jgi:hypothetical protein
MAILNTKIPEYKPQKDLEIDYTDFSGGLNSIFRPTELKPSELAEAQNLMLTGKGVPTGRWGSQEYFDAGSGWIRLLHDYNQSSANDLLALTDTGYLVKKSGTSYAVITGASFPSGYNAQAEQLGGNLYITQAEQTFMKYDGTNLLPYATLPSPTGVTATMISGASGVTTWSWRITALSQVGETLGSTAITLDNMALDLKDTGTNVLLSWNTVSGPSGTLKGYSVYRGLQGDETYIGGTGPTETSFYDYGTPQSDIMFPPLSDTTGGPKAKYVLKFDDRLVLAGIDGDPSLVLISGRYPYQDRFNWTDGGGYIRINPDGGDEITGLGISGSQTQGGTTPASILIFMQNSVHQLVLKSLTLGNYILLDPQAQMLAPTGCSSADTIVGVDNNTFYFGRKGLFTVGSEAAYLNQIRTKEISARIRPYIKALTKNDFDHATAAYIDYKYLLSFPDRKETMMYDFERACYMGPWNTPWGLTKWTKYTDSAGTENWCAGTTQGDVKVFGEAYKNDCGTTIAKSLKTKKEAFKNWNVMKVIKSIYFLFKNVSGPLDVNIILEDRSGTASTAKSFEISGVGSSGVAGWGTDTWGSSLWGSSIAKVMVASEEIIRWSQLYKTARTIQVEVKSTDATSNWEFLGVRATAQPMSEGSLSSSTRV